MKRNHDTTDLCSQVEFKHVVKKERSESSKDVTTRESYFVLLDGNLSTCLDKCLSTFTFSLEFGASTLVSLSEVFKSQSYFITQYKCDMDLFSHEFDSKFVGPADTRFLKQLLIEMDLGPVVSKVTELELGNYNFSAKELSKRSYEMICDENTLQNKLIVIFTLSLETIVGGCTRFLNSEGE